MSDSFIKQATCIKKDESHSNESTLGYTEYNARDMVDEAIYFHDMELLTPDVDPTRVARKTGKTYYSARAGIYLYNHDEQETFKNWVELFDNYKGKYDELTVYETSPLFSLVRALSNDVHNNKFVVSYSGLQDAVSNVRAGKARVIEVVSSSGYVDVVFDFLALE